MIIKNYLNVIPAKAGIYFLKKMDPGSSLHFGRDDRLVRHPICSFLNNIYNMIILIKKLSSSV